MPDVYAWPPVGIVGHEHTIDRPGSMSRGLSGRAVYSQARPTRRLVTAEVSGIGPDLVGAGYVEQLKRMLDGKLPLVRMTPLPQHWIGATWRRGLTLGALPLNWVAGAVPLNWTDGAATLTWTTGDTITGTSGGDGTWYFLDCTGLPPGALIAPSEPVTVGSVTRHCIRAVRADASGAARIWLDGALSSGAVVIGRQESIAFLIEDYPRARQTADRDFVYRFELIEAFESEYADGFTEVNPWT